MSSQRQLPAQLQARPGGKMPLASSSAAAASSLPPPSPRGGSPYLVQPVQVHLLSHGDVTQCQDLNRAPESESQAPSVTGGVRPFPRRPAPQRSRPGSGSQETLPAGGGQPPRPASPRLFQARGSCSRTFLSRAHWALVHLQSNDGSGLAGPRILKRT